MISIKQLSMESQSDDDTQIDQGDIAEETLIQVEFDADNPDKVSLEERGVLRRIGGDIADHYKMLFAWADGNGAKIRRIRQQVRAAREKLRGITITGDIRGNGLLTYLGNDAHHAQTAKLLVEVIEKDVSLTNKVLVPMIHNTGEFTKELVEWIYAKDNDWKWGYEEAVNGCIPIINSHISKLIAGVRDRKVEGYDHNDLRVEDGSEFSELFLGNYAISSSWNYAHEQAKHLPTASEALSTYATEGGHDFVKVPKHGNKYSLTGQISKEQLLKLLDAADAYLDAADEASKSIKSNAGPVFKMLMMSNLFGGHYTAAIKGSFSKNYRSLYHTMFVCRNWSMKLQRKSATRNQDIAKHLAEFVSVNTK